ncbi:MAG TPA: ribosome small subunit-dependent GTPase A [Bacteroidales bacterium]|nr:ribosome small subunit-dependent GTPase A [Bacteroidales bacterium]
MKTGRIIQTTGAVHSVECDNLIYTCVIKGKLRLKGYRSTNPLSVGDIVEFEETENLLGLINKIHSRKNCIIRKSTNLSKETHIIASNIDQLVIMFTLQKPETTTIFLDRLLIAAESYSIPCIILINKIDIYSSEELKHSKYLSSIYTKIGYKTIEISVENKVNIDNVAEILKDKISLIVGHSGTGKTSLINVIAPEYRLKTDFISEYHLAGKHTTTFARMLKLPFGGYIVDTPGIMGFGLVNLKKEEMYHYFPEIFKLSPNCKYYNCTHINEPQCAVKKALEKGVISLSRYKSYLNVFYDDDDKHRIKEI